jgi:hypothetical protein
MKKFFSPSGEKMAVRPDEGALHFCDSPKTEN